MEHMGGADQVLCSGFRHSRLAHRAARIAYASLGAGVLRQSGLRRGTLLKARMDQCGPGRNGQCRGPRFRVHRSMGRRVRLRVGEAATLPKCYVGGWHSAKAFAQAIKEHTVLFGPMAGWHKIEGWHFMKNASNVMKPHKFIGPGCEKPANSTNNVLLALSLLCRGNPTRPMACIASRCCVVASTWYNFLPLPCWWVMIGASFPQVLPVQGRWVHGPLRRCHGTRLLTSTRSCLCCMRGA